MQKYNITDARKNISQIISRVKFGNEIFGIERNNKVEAYVVPVPEGDVSGLEIAKYAESSGSLNFLHDEPDLYTVEDLKVRY